MAGEMNRSDIEEGGEFYEARLKLEEMVKKSSHRPVVFPFDKYQGPYAEISNLHHKVVGKLWLGEDDETFVLEVEGEMKEISSHDELFYLLISSYELFSMDVELVKVKPLKSQIKVDIIVEGIKYKNVTLGRVPNHNDVSITLINNEETPYIELESSSKHYKKKRIIYLS